MHVKRCRICCADPFKSSFAAPEFHATLEVRVKNPHAFLSPKASGWSQLSPEAILLQGGEDKGEAWEEAECDGLSSIQYQSLLLSLREILFNH